MTWRDRFRRLYRRLFNRCTLCGAAREPVSGDVYTQGPFCRKHNKLFLSGGRRTAWVPRRLKSLPGGSSEVPF